MCVPFHTPGGYQLYAWSMQEGHLMGLDYDDMQWACKSTLDLLKSISLDSDIPYLFIVGAYRDDQIQE